MNNPASELARLRWSRIPEDQRSKEMSRIRRKGIANSKRRSAKKRRKKKPLD